jgi:hypothetical protein
MLTGEIPRPDDPPSGCRFRTRCPVAVARCAAEAPPLREVAPAHRVACHFAGPWPGRSSQPGGRGPGGAGDRSGSATGLSAARARARDGSATCIINAYRIARAPARADGRATCAKSPHAWCARPRCRGRKRRCRSPGRHVRNPPPDASPPQRAGALPTCRTSVRPCWLRRPKVGFSGTRRRTRSTTMSVFAQRPVLSPLAEARAWLGSLGLGAAPPPAPTTLLAEDLVVRAPLPPLPTARRSGWAVAAEATLGAAPYSPVPVPGARPVAAGEALAAGTDAVLPPEAATDAGPWVEVTAAIAPRRGRRPAGGHFPEDQVLARAGTEPTLLARLLASGRRGGDASAFAPGDARGPVARPGRLPGDRGGSPRGPIEDTALGHDEEGRPAPVSSHRSGSAPPRLARPSRSRGQARRCDPRAQARLCRRPYRPRSRPPRRRGWRRRLPRPTRPRCPPSSWLPAGSRCRPRARACARAGE